MSRLRWIIDWDGTLERRVSRKGRRNLSKLLIAGCRIVEQQFVSCVSQLLKTEIRLVWMLKKSRWEATEQEVT